MVHIVVSKRAPNASSQYIWSKLENYSDFSWHPTVATSKDIGNVPDGSSNMIGAVRLLKNDAGKELTETVTAWDTSKKYYSCSIDEGRPPFAKKLVIGFKVRDDPRQGVIVDTIVDLDLKGPFVILTPLIKLVLPKKIGSLTQGIADLQEQ